MPPHLLRLLQYCTEPFTTSFHMKLSATLRFVLLTLQAGSSGMTRTLLNKPIYFPTWPISPTIGRKIIKRQFTFCGHTEEMTGTIQWHSKGSATDWHQEFFSYKWLQDVAAIQSDKVASSFAREFINGFTLISKADAVHPSAWETEVVGERLTHWLYYRHFVLKGGSGKFFTRYQRSLIKHIRLLYQTALMDSESLGPNAIKGLIAAGNIFPQLAFMLPEALEWLEQLLKRDVLGDGGHISESPNYHLSFLKTLIEIRELLDASDHAFAPLSETILRMGTILRFFCHGDGRLGLFRDNMMEDALILARAIELSGTHAPVPLHAPESGYSGLRAGNVCLMMRLCGESGVPPLGVASCEFSDGEERVIVNCGTYTGVSRQWREATRQPSAFSTVTLEGEDTLDVLSPVSAEVIQRVELKEGRMISHIGYALSPHIRHERHVELDASGVSVKGKDTLTLSEGAIPSNVPPIVARFHLHPDIRCQPQKEGGIVLKSVSGAQWIFSCNHPRHVAISESVYLGYHGKPQKTLQLTITIPVVKTVASVSWELKKL
jgi:uncharacterized heparinase superfamily protein